MNDEGRLHSAPATSQLTDSEDTTEVGASWRRCPDCGARCPTADHLVRHQVRVCIGHGYRALRLMPRRRQP
jgi:hypothetical protein